MMSRTRTKLLRIRSEIINSFKEAYSTGFWGFGVQYGPGVDCQRIFTVFAKYGLRIHLSAALWAATLRKALNAENRNWFFVLNTQKCVHRQLSAGRLRKRPCTRSSPPPHVIRAS